MQFDSASFGAHVGSTSTDASREAFFICINLWAMSSFIVFFVAEQRKLSGVFKRPKFHPAACAARLSWKQKTSVFAYGVRVHREPIILPSRLSMTTLIMNQPVSGSATGGTYSIVPSTVPPLLSCRPMIFPTGRVGNSPS